MAGSRRSARVAAQQSSSPSSSQAASPPQATPSKRKSEVGTSPSAKRGKKAPESEQKTLEETIGRAPVAESDSAEPKPAHKEITSAPSAEAPHASENEPIDTTHQEPEPMKVDDNQPEEPATNGDTHKSGGHEIEKKKLSEESKQEPVIEPVKEPEHEQTMTTGGESKQEATTAMEKQAPVTKEEQAKQQTSTAASSQQPAIGEEGPKATLKPDDEQKFTTAADEPMQTTINTVSQPSAARVDEPKQEPVKEAETSRPAATQESRQEPAQTVSHTKAETAVEEHGRDKEPPASILEKGLIYFLFRGRVNIDEPSEVDDIARSYMVMRPLPKDASLGDGPIGDDGNCRLLALPKKVLPLSGKDKFLSFVEQAKTTLKDLKDNAFSSSDYMTQTAGARHKPAMTPVAEGVYAITTTGRESHLAYVITIPSELGDVQKDVGIRKKGSFVVSAKNPQQPGPANTQLPQRPNYPQEILDEFRTLRWMPLQPKLLDYVHTQFLLIGESGGIDNALQTQKEDEGKDHETPHEEIEKLEGEDEIRVKHLKGDDAIFTDLGLSSKDFSKVPSTW